MADVFISYKSERRAAARHLAQILELNGFSAWYDYGLIPGEDFEKRLMAELGAAKVVLVLWCEMSVASKWVLKEATAAKAAGKLLPSWIQRATPPGEFARDDIVDLTEWDGAPRSHALDRLLDDVGRRLRRDPAPQFHGLRELDATWRSFGAPSLAAFALNAAPKPRSEAPEATPRTQSQRPAVSRFEPLSTFRDRLRKPVKIGGVLGLGGRELTREGPEMVVIPEGEFMMGSPENEPQRDDDEGPQHLVRIANRFALGKYAVTRGEFAAFVAATGHDMSGGIYCFDGKNLKLDASKSWRDPGFAQDDRHPVVGVSWHDAQGYCKWLSVQSGVEYRLPSEAEWEYACRAGTTTPFWWGREITPDQANYDGRSVYAGGGAKGVYREKTVPVDLGEFKANPFGLHQMHGNVWEWCDDAWNDSYDGAPDDGEVWIFGDEASSILRGGSWGSNPDWLRSAFRARNLRVNRGRSRGFRVARTIVSP